ncbi:MAG TPA: signal peptide peptidase SppA [Bacteroidales bacterium]|nr:signal peptide peptidase SppA [Bacteroidales bacterium]HOL98703.1 signal peptide peptidase SppA [Bacteroidales bacterium]HUM33123.1 signal peptide peptidase SppA [Bacteroidales bacterium]
MKTFWKYTLATIVGSLLTFILIFGIIFGIFGVMLSGFGEQEVVIKDNSVLKISLKYDIPDKTSDNPFSNMDFGTFKTTKVLGLNDILKTIEKAKADDRIKGIYLDISSVPAGLATIEEIRNKLLDFKTSGKFVVTYTSVLTQKSYYLASVSDKIFLNHQGGMEWKGLYSQVMFFKGALEKLGIEAQIFRHGQFKSAIEPFISDKMSEANKLQTSVLLNSIWNDITKKIGEARNITPQRLNEIADSMLVMNAESALKYGFVDSLIYYDEFLQILTEMTGNDKKDEMFISINKYSKAKVEVKKKNTSNNLIAVIFAEGDIVDGGEQEGSIGGDWMAEQIRKVRENDDIKAVVLRVNSPGGSGLASEIIWREAKLTNEKKPVVVSMGNLAASGGYYISCPASYIFALPNTITGSIGVFGLIPNFQKLMNEKLGITYDGVGTNKYSDFGTVLRPFNENERAIIQLQIENFYDLFITRVADGRGLIKAQVDSIGQGRVWSGLNAIEIGLVDQIGGINDAVRKAAELAKLNDYRIKEYPEKQDYFQKFLTDLSENTSEKAIKKALGENYKLFKMLQNIEKMTGIQARMEYVIDIQ